MKQHFPLEIFQRVQKLLQVIKSRYTKSVIQYKNPFERAENILNIHDTLIYPQGTTANCRKKEVIEFLPNNFEFRPLDFESSPLLWNWFSYISLKLCLIAFFDESSSLLQNLTQHNSMKMKKLFKPKIYCIVALSAFVVTMVTSLGFCPWVT